MSKTSMRLNIVLPRYVLDYVDEIAKELDCSRSEAIADIIEYMVQYHDEFLEQYDLVRDEEEDEDEEEEDEEDEEDEDEEL